MLENMLSFKSTIPEGANIPRADPVEAASFSNLIII